MDPDVATEPVPISHAEPIDHRGNPPVDVDRPAEATLDAVEDVLGDVESALRHLDDGTYGRCDSCGEAIDDAQLAASPMARTCAGCDGATHS
jgi:RNA polymerase-binding transcription factor DksA